MSVCVVVVLPTLLPVVIAPCVLLLVVVFIAMRATTRSADAQMLLAGLLMAWVTFTGAVNVADPGGYHVALTGTLPMIALFVLLYAYITDLFALRAVLGALLVAGAIKAFQFLAYATPGGTGLIEGIDVTFRPTLPNSNLYSYMCVVAVLSGLALNALGGLDLKLRTLTLGTCAFCLSAIVYSGTRGALVGVILGCAVGVMAIRFPRGVRFALVISLTVWAVAFVSMAGEFTTVASEVFQRKKDFLFLDGREKFWPLAQEMIWERPVLGHGLTGYTYIFPISAPPHNLPLAIALALGIPGLILVMMIILWAVRPVRVTERDRVPAAISCLLIGGLWPMWSTGVVEWLWVGWVAVAAAGAVTKMTSVTDARGGRTPSRSRLGEVRPVG